MRLAGSNNVSEGRSREGILRLRHLCLQVTSLSTEAAVQPKRQQNPVTCWGTGSLQAFHLADRPPRQRAENGSSTLSSAMEKLSISDPCLQVQSRRRSKALQYRTLIVLYSILHICRFSFFLRGLVGCKVRYMLCKGKIWATCINSH